MYVIYSVYNLKSEIPIFFVLSDYVYTLSKDDITNLIHPSALVTDYAKESGCEVFFSDGADKTFDGRGFSWLRDGNDIHKQRSVASISKIMTAVLAIESNKMNDNLNLYD